MSVFPNEIFKLVTYFAWGRSLSYHTLLKQLDHCSDVQSSIPEDLMSLIVFDFDIHQNIPNPYRQFQPFAPLDSLDPATIWSSLIYTLPAYLKSDYFTRNKTYRSVLKRHIDKLIKGGFKEYNHILERFLIQITETDFIYEVFDLHLFYEILSFCEPLNSLL